MTTTETQEAWAAPRHEPDLPPALRKRWQDGMTLLRETAQRYGWSKAEVAHRSGIPAGTLSQVYDGNYAGKVENQLPRIERWLDSIAELTAAAALIPVAPGYVPTPSSRELVDTLLYGQMMPSMVVVTYGAGMGKTVTAHHYRDSHPHAYLVTMRPTTKTVHGMLLELNQALGVNERSPARLDRALGEKLRRNGRNTLLIIDEAQNLADQAVNQLRYFLDEFGVAIGLLGNEELYGRFGGAKPTPAYAQIHRRIGKRLRRLQPQEGDVDALIEAWGIKDAAVRGLCRTIGKKPGALSQITQTLQLAGMYAAGEGVTIATKHIKTAWNNRGGEEA